MMRKFFLGITVLNSVGIALFLFFSFTSRPQIAYVDSARLLNEYTGMQAARKQFQSKAVVWKANIDTLNGELKQHIQKYENEKGKATIKELHLYKNLIESKENRVIDYQNAIKVQAAQEEEKVTTEVINQVNLYLKEYGREHGFEIIMAVTQYGNIAYADDQLNITDEVLKGLNRQYSGK